MFLRDQAKYSSEKHWERYPDYNPIYFRIKKKNNQMNNTAKQTTRSETTERMHDFYNKNTMHL